MLMVHDRITRIEQEEPIKRNQHDDMMIQRNKQHAFGSFRKMKWKWQYFVERSG